MGNLVMRRTLKQGKLVKVRIQEWVKKSHGSPRTCIDHDFATMREAERWLLVHNRCQFPTGAGWGGSLCGENSDGGKLCDRHANLRCGCGKHAVELCSAASSFVCGAPTCGDHDGFCPHHAYT